MRPSLPFVTRCPHRGSAGFTLLEIMVAIAIVAIMVMWGMPSMQRMLASQRLNSVAADFRTAFSLARFESYGQGRRVVMAKNCALDSGGCTNSENWNRGFTIFSCRGTANVTDQCAAVYARGETNQDCNAPGLTVSSENCVSTPSAFYQAGTAKQVFEGFTRFVRVCDDRSSGTNFRSTTAMVFNPNGSVYYNASGNPQSAANLTFYLYQDRGGVGSDLVYRMMLSGDGQLTAIRDDSVDISAQTSGCETINLN